MIEHLAKSDNEGSSQNEKDGQRFTDAPANSETQQTEADILRSFSKDDEDRLRLKMDFAILPLVGLIYRKGLFLSLTCFA